MRPRKYKTERGFHGFNQWKSAHYGLMRVQESSAAFKGACVWIFTEMQDTSEKTQDKAHAFHLSCVDAKNLRDALSKILKVPAQAKAGLRNWKKWKSVWHGQIRVRDAKNLSDERAIYVSGDLSYSNTPEENPPHLDLSVQDARHLRDGLSAFLKEAMKDKLVEPFRKTQPKAGW